MTAGFIIFGKKFQHTAARRRLQRKTKMLATKQRFNTQPPEGGCADQRAHHHAVNSFNTQPPEGGCVHNRFCPFRRIGFNTQPPEGGCFRAVSYHQAIPRSFNTQPPEGGCSRL